MTHEEVRDLLTEYVLGALDAKTRADVDAHLAACPECRALQAEEARVFDALGRGVEPVAPPASLRDRILASARNERVAPAPAPVSFAAPRAARSLPWMLAAAAAIIALVAGWQLFAAKSERERLAAQVTEQQRSLAVLAAPDLIRFELRGTQPSTAQARAFWSHKHGLVFTAEGLQAVPADRTYQLWVISGGKPISVGIFEAGAAGAASIIVETPATLTAVDAVAITVEPAGGLSAPSTTPILAGTPGN